MRIEDAVEVVRRMHHYEQHPRFDGYDVTLDEYQRAAAAYPVTMALALLQYKAELAGQAVAVD